MLRKMNASNSITLGIIPPLVLFCLLLFLLLANPLQAAITNLTLTTPAVTAPQPAGTTIPLHASCSYYGEGDVEYMFRAIAGSTTYYNSGYSLETQANWTPTLTGIYTLRVDIREVGTTTSYYTTISFLITSIASATLSTPGYPSPQHPGEITLQAGVSYNGNGTLEYKFSSSLSGAEGISVVQDFTTVNSCSWNPTATGRYKLYLYVREQGCVSGYERLVEISSYVISSIDSVTLSASPEAPMPCGSEITLAADVSYSGLGTLEYKFQYRVGDVYTTISSDYTTSSTCVWNSPATSGNYLLYVFVREVGCPSVYEVASMVYNMVSPITGLTLTTPNTTFPQPTGNEILLRATPTLSAAATIEYQFKTYIGGAYQTIRDFATDPDFIWIPTTAGTYNLYVYARQVGSFSPYEKSAYLTSRIIIADTPPTVSLISPENGAIILNTEFPVSITATATDDVSISKTEFYCNGELMGPGDTTAPYSFNWNSATPDSYQLTAKAYDNYGSSTVSTSVTVVVNSLPSVSLLEPLGNVIYTDPEYITLRASATETDPGDSISQVVFYQGVVPIGQGTLENGYYVLQWSNMLAGEYTLTAKATDTHSGVTTSSPVTITVKTRLAPIVNMVEPTSGTSLITNFSTLAAVEAVDCDGEISSDSVRFLLNGEAVGNGVILKDGLYQTTITPRKEQLGYILYVEVKDNDYNTTVISSGFMVTNPPPYVRLVQPTANMQGNIDPTCTLLAEAFDENSGIEKVEFYLGDTNLLGTDTDGAPYELEGFSFSLGAQVKAKAFDKDGGVAWSEPVYLFEHPFRPILTFIQPNPSNEIQYSLTSQVTFQAQVRVSWDGPAPHPYHKVKFIIKNSLGNDVNDPVTVRYDNDGSDGYTAPYDNVDLPPGTYTLHATILDAQENEINNSINATTRFNVTASPVQNNRVISPTQSAYDLLVGMMEVEAYDPSGVQQINFLIDGIQVDTAITRYSTNTYRKELPDNLANGQHIFQAIVVTNGNGQIPLPEQSFTIAPLGPDTMIIAPGDSMNYYTTQDSPSGATIFLEAEAWMWGYYGQVQDVTFFLDGQQLPTADPPDPEVVNPITGILLPYRYRLNPGSITLDQPHTVYSRVRDKQGRSASSPAVSFTITNPKPTVAITSPTPTQHISAPGPLVITASAADLNGYVRSVEFQAKGPGEASFTTIFTDVGDPSNPVLRYIPETGVRIDPLTGFVAPYRIIWRFLKPGGYILRAVATDNEGATTTSSEVTVTVDPPLAPWEGSEPTAGPLSLTRGILSLSSNADIAVYNPSGVDVGFGLSYYSDRAFWEESSPGLPAGWFHNYDITIVDNTLCYPNGAKEPLGTTGAPYRVNWNSITFKDGTCWTFELFGSVKRIISISNLAGKSVNFEYGIVSNKLERIIDNRTNKILLNLTYFDNQWLTSVEDQSVSAQYNEKITYSYLNYKLATVSSRFRGALRSFDYGESFRGRQLLTGIKKPHANSGELVTALTATYAFGRPELLTAANGARVFCKQYGPQNAQVITKHKTEDSIKANYLQHYGNAGRMTGTTNALGYRNEITFNADGLPTLTKDHDGVWQIRGFDQYGNVTQLAQPGNIRIHYTYDYNYTTLPGRLTQTQVKDQYANLLYTPLNISYNIAGFVQQISTLRTGATTDNDRLITSYTYDEIGNVTEVTVPNANGGTIKTTYSYTGFWDRLMPYAGQPLKVKVEGGQQASETQYRYDDNNRLVEMIKPGKPSTIISYTDADQVQSVLNSTSSVGQTYTFAGGPAKTSAVLDWATQQPFGAYQMMEYGASGEVVKQKSIFPGAGDNEKLEFGYDELLRMNYFADQNNTPETPVAMSWEYDMAGRLSHANLPDGSVMTVTSYTAGGMPVTVEITGKGQTQTVGYQYDPELMQLTNVYYSGSSELNTAISYDDEGRVTQVVDGAHVKSITGRDITGNTVQMSQSYSDGPNNLAYHYDYNQFDGSLEGQSTPVGDYNYDADDLGRTVAVSGPQGTTEYRYEEETGRLLEQTLYDNSEPGNKIAYTVYEYDNNGRLSRLAHYKPATPTDELIAEYTNFTYDLAERRTGFTANLPALLPQYSGTHAFTYNAKGELIGEAFTPTDTQYPATTRGHGYSAAGNITNLKGTQRGYNGANQLTQEWVNGAWVTVADYDGRGNPTEYRSHELEFNQGNHLTAFDETLTAGYISDGRRIWKEVNGRRTFFVYNGERVIGEMDASGNPTAVNTIGNTGLISREQGGNGPAIYYLFDPLGNVLHRLDDDGAVVSSDVYDAWGNREYTTDVTGDPYGFKGQFGYYTDHETGLILCTHRYYDPQTGRWLTKDPIGHEGGVNLYGYCNNDPVNAVDPSGQVLETVLDIAGIGWSAYDLWNDPSWGNAGFLAWDVAATIVPFAPGSYVAKAGRLGLKGSKRLKSVTRASEFASYGRDANYVSNFANSRQMLALPAPSPMLALPAPKMNKHHIFPQNEIMKTWFAKKGITNIHDYTVEVDSAFHSRGVHGNSSIFGPNNILTPADNWNKRWKIFMNENPRATKLEIYQFAGSLMDEFGLSGLPIVPY